MSWCPGGWRSRRGWKGSAGSTGPPVGHTHTRGSRSTTRSGLLVEYNLETEEQMGRKMDISKSVESNTLLPTGERRDLNDVSCSNYIVTS